jgi:glutamine synthetase
MAAVTSSVVDVQYDPQTRWTRDEILRTSRELGVRFLRLQFSDITGVNKNVEVPFNQFEKALDGEIAFDGSSIEGFVRIEESDMILVPEFDTFRIFPFATSNGSEEAPDKVARIICDIYNPDGSPFQGCPRLALKRVTDEAKALGYTMMAGPEAEFFLFQRDRDGAPTTQSHDAGGYFDLTPVDRGEDARRDIVRALEAMGFEVEAAHHEVAPAQHEIDFKYAEAITTADNIATFRFIVRHVAMQHGLHATFMPKPVFAISGSGMHTHQSLFKDGENAFYDADGEHQLSETALHYVGGILKHARGFCAITNPLVNSYKRLVPDYEAPTNVAWSMRNRSPLVRIPEKRGMSTRVEVRMPDPSANSYLALAVMLKSGLDGIHNRIDPGPPVNKNIYAMSQRERRRLKISELPGDLREAVDALEKDKVVCDGLTPHILEHFVTAKRAEWHDYIAQVHEWELKRYLSLY